MRPGDLVLVRFPQTDLRTGKLRPALVVALAPGPYSDVLLALVTSREHQVIPGFDEDMGERMDEEMKRISKKL